MNNLTELYKQWRGEAPASVEKLAGAGSNRQYYRFADGDGKTVIGVVGTSREEDHAFISLARHFTLRKLPVPEVLAVSDDEMRYLQTDLGHVSLFDAIKGGREAGGRYNQRERQLLLKTIRELPNIQIRGARGLDFSVCYPQPEFDEDSVLFDLNYFKYCFLKATELDFNELKLEANFRMLAKDLTSETAESFLYRDFQARNVMLDAGGNPYFIDFQGGRKGPFYYDLASFLWQASAHYSFKLRRELVFEYYQSLKQYTEVPNERHFVERLSLFVLFRTLQVLGAYGFRGYFERKPHFLQSIPPAIDNLRDLLKLNPSVFPYPYLMDLLRRLTEMPRFAHQEPVLAKRKDGFKTTDNPLYASYPQDGPATFSKYDGKGPLVVRVYSFSYKKGIPEDPSGNGGGFVFDCRALPNPGRYPEYKSYTGKDRPVVEFLQGDPAVEQFIAAAEQLVGASVTKYLERNFTNLSVSFGCTGGQHRSVFCAERVAKWLSENYKCQVVINHIEQQ